jgi:hypothetical protein
MSKLSTTEKKRVPTLNPAMLSARQEPALLGGCDSTSTLKPRRELAVKVECPRIGQ